MTGIIYKGLKYAIIWIILYFIVKYLCSNKISDIDSALIAAVITLLLSVFEIMSTNMTNKPETMCNVNNAIQPHATFQSLANSTLPNTAQIGLFDKNVNDMTNTPNNMANLLNKQNVMQSLMYSLSPESTDMSSDIATDLSSNVSSELSDIDSSSASSDATMSSAESTVSSSCNSCKSSDMSTSAIITNSSNISMPSDIPSSITDVSDMSIISGPRVLGNINRPPDTNTSYDMPSYTITPANRYSLIGLPNDPNTKPIYTMINYEGDKVIFDKDEFGGTRADTIDSTTNNAINQNNIGKCGNRDNNVIAIPKVSHTSQSYIDVPKDITTTAFINPSSIIATTHGHGFEGSISKIPPGTSIATNDKWYEQIFNPRDYSGAENLDQIKVDKWGKTRNDILVNEMRYSDFNRLPPSFNKDDFEYGYSMLPPKDWYPLPPYPPVCSSAKTCPVCPVNSDPTTLNLKEWHTTQRLGPPESMNTDYIIERMNSYDG